MWQRGMHFCTCLQYNIDMRPTPTSSFVRSVIGFAVFLSISFGVTYAVNTMTAEETREEQVAAAAARMLEPLK